MALPPLPKPTKLFVMYVGLPALTALSIWLWIHHERGKVRDLGFAECVSAGHDAAWCQAAADKNHDRCMELTFRPGSRGSGSSFDGQGYVECLDLGATEFWKVSAERAAARRRGDRQP